MGIFAFILIIIFISGLLLWRDRRNFIAGIIFAASVINLILLSVLIGASMLANSSNIGKLSFLVFILLGMVGIPAFAGFSLIVNTYIMQTREGKSLTAKLSLIFGLNFLFMLLSGFALLFLRAQLGILTGVLLTVLGIDVTFTFIFVCYLFYSFIYQMIPVKGNIDYIITLGAGVRSEKVSPLLKARLDKALEYYHKQKELVKMVVSGGQGPDEPVSEAFAMAKYLGTQKVPNQKIIKEDRSTTTFENMRFSKQKIEQDWKKETPPRVIFSTNNYHVLRGAIYARKAGLNANGVGSPTSFYFLPSALIREFIALLVIYKWFTGLILVGWIGFGSLLMFVS
ncbi:YdcF family protein [Pediococcus stilesii]|uniref:YdcF family protein n=1 Tax=Pediococcus stilesii TaxID=331679 RepID=A0A0R2KV70_9LACO|nr:YdcF family protein [Pediococcus stilesii]KRN93475.1 hypothetical protein IV81_GL000476 [Pediococcus stilesii]TLQ03674.1 YdcF family protein [Pediococcus stilesii]